MRCVDVCTDARCVLVPQMTKSVTCPDELGTLASQVTGDYSQLAVQGRLAAHTAEPEEVRKALVSPKHGLIPHCCGAFIFLIRIAACV